MNGESIESDLYCTVEATLLRAGFCHRASEASHWSPSPSPRLKAYCGHCYGQPDSLAALTSPRLDHREAETKTMKPHPHDNNLLHLLDLMRLINLSPLSRQHETPQYQDLAA